MTIMTFIIVTGASSGIGAAAALELTRQGHQVLATGRSADKLAAVHQQMRSAAESPETTPEPITANLADFNDITRLAGIILDRCPRLDMLINNAGVQPSRRQLSVDGLELTLAVNHLAPFLLTNLLSERLISDAGRVITTASSNHKRGSFDFSDLQMTQNWDAGKAYDRSKLANILFTIELQARTGIPASSFHPGTITTDLNREARFVRWVKPMEKIFMSPPEKGADTLVWLATSAEGDAPSARYYYKRRPHKISAAAADRTLAAQLWDVSAKLVGLTTT